MIDRRRILALAAVAAFLVLTVGPAALAAVVGSPTLTPRVVQSGLEYPWDIAFAPDGRMFVTERPGRIRIFASGNAGAALLKTFTISNVHASGESGAMGIALDPDFATNGYLYVCVSRDDESQWRNQVIRYRVTGTAFAFDRYLVRRGALAASNHDGCRIRFGPGGKLWVTMGDAGDGSLAQDPGAYNGKVLRVNRDGSIPATNPIMPGAAARTAVYSMGHRNPQGIAFQPGTGRVYAVEHGPDCDDEINWIRAGRNYGWPIEVGTEPGEPYSNPAWESDCPTIAPSGATFVTGANWGSLEGRLFVATLKEQDLRRFWISGDGLTAVQKGIHYDGRWGRLRAAVLGPAGRLYLTTSNGVDDRIIRIVATVP